MLQYSIGVFLYVIYTWTLDNVQLSTVQWTYQISINMIIFTPTLAALLDPFPHSTSCSCSSSLASTATQRRHTCVNFSFILDRLYLLREASEIKWPESNLMQFLVAGGSEGPHWQPSFWQWMWESRLWCQPALGAAAGRKVTELRCIFQTRVQFSPKDVNAVKESIFNTGNSFSFRGVFFSNWGVFLLRSHIFF